MKLCSVIKISMLEESLTCELWCVLLFLALESQGHGPLIEDERP